jgi:hypothetical protein
MEAMLMSSPVPFATTNDVVPEAVQIDRRAFFTRGLGLALATGSLPTLLAACGGDEEPEQSGDQRRTGRAVVGDVLDFSLRSGEWAGAFGFVKLRLHRAFLDGASVYFIQTDTSDAEFARERGLVHAPKVAPLAGAGLTGDLYLPDGNEPAVVSSEPGRRDYTPAWRVYRVKVTGESRRLRSIADVRAAERAGQIQITKTDIVLNAPIVNWSSGALAVDGKLRDYLGDGQLIERPDTERLEVTFKLHECFPGSRYIVTDHSISPAAQGTHTVYAPGLHDRTIEAGATGRTNVFMNGLRGPGPMKHQPSVFDSDAGQPQWSPYWDHYTMEWRDGRKPRVLRRQREVLAARDGRELREFPGVPDTKGEVFTVNCPVPVVAPATFRT